MVMVIKINHNMFFVNEHDLILNGPDKIGVFVHIGAIAFAGRRGMSWHGQHKEPSPLPKWSTSASWRARKPTETRHGVDARGNPAKHANEKRVLESAGTGFRKTNWLTDWLSKQTTNFLPESEQGPGRKENLAQQASKAPFLPY